jgi:hypothetical protein
MASPGMNRDSIQALLLDPYEGEPGSPIRIDSASVFNPREFRAEMAAFRLQNPFTRLEIT